MHCLQSACSFKIPGRRRKRENLIFILINQRCECFADSLYLPLNFVTMKISQPSVSFVIEYHRQYLPFVEILLSLRRANAASGHIKLY